LGDIAVSQVVSIQWVLGILIAAQAGLLSFYIHHIIACNTRDNIRAKENEQIKTSLAGITEVLRRVQTDIGTHETGLRGQVHQLASDIAPYVVRSQMEKRPK
jgi:hypothetical protein